MNRQEVRTALFLDSRPLIELKTRAAFETYATGRVVTASALIRSFIERSLSGEKALPAAPVSPSDRL
jgi:hypothetical protein